MAWLTPARRRGVELLDDPDTTDDVRRASMSDLARSNTFFGGTRSVLRALRALTGIPARPVLLDVGTGGADIAVRARLQLAWAGKDALVIGVDAAESELRAALARMNGALVGDARRLPLRDGSADIVTCSQLLHHFETTDAVRGVVRELHRVSRGWVIISDLRRSWFAAAGFWLASVLLRFHPVTRHDGVVSVFRGFTADELGALVREATGVTPVIRTGIFWRVSATWRTA